MDRSETRANPPVDPPPPSSRQDEAEETTLPKDLHEAALALSLAQRAQLADELLGSLEEYEDEPKSEVEAAWAEEIRRRVEAYDRGELETYAFSEVRRWAFQRMTSGR